MRYTCQTTIGLPRERVIELFDDIENHKTWQPGLVSYEHISGTPGEPGAKTRLVYKMGKCDIEMIETVTNRALPDAFDGTYEAKGVLNTVKNRFTDQGGSTLWTVETEFACKGLMKLMAALMPGAFKKQTMIWMAQFKQFAESKCG